MGVTATPGFVANGAACGIKPTGALDLAVVATSDGTPVPAAATFTQNQVVAAPVTISRSHLATTAGHAAAVIVNSGNANAGTGEEGLTAARTMCSAVAQALGCDPTEVLVCSTGHIGSPLPIDRISAAIPDLVAGRSREPERALAAAHAMMTTDTHPKVGVVRRGEIIVAGIAKGAGMIAPNMATMLALLTTNAPADPAVLQKVLIDGVAGSFNTVSIDGCTSTNDTVILLGNGSPSSGSSSRGAPVAMSGADEDALGEAVSALCEDLATQIAGDGEGHTKVVRVRVTGAASDGEARIAARQVAGSLLVKCSWYGSDPYWGRVASELGSAGVSLDVDQLSIAYGGVVVSRGCVEVEHDRGAVEEHMAGEYLDLHCDLGVGSGAARVLTNDLTHAYVDENMGTS
jgi:glutamate N-acetyltransferase / amino-acid N-acetyltransferase